MKDISKYKKYCINKNIQVPLYFQIKNILTNMLEEGVLKPGEMIPTEFELCSIYGISRTTIRQALKELVDEGIFYRVKGRGTFVSHEKIVHDLYNNSFSVSTSFKEKGLTSTTSVLEYHIIKSSQLVSNKLSIPINSDVISFKRIYYANNIPMAIVHSYLNYSLCKNITNYDMVNESMYKILSNDLETKIFKTNRIIGASVPTKEDLNLLEITKTTGILVVNTIGYNKFDVPVEYTISRYRSDKNLFGLNNFSS